MADRLVRGTVVAERLVRGTALAELLAREPPAQRTAGRDVVAELLLAGNRRHRGLPAGAPWQSKGTAVAERHREDVAYCSTADEELLRSKDAAVAERLVRGTAMAELLLAREPPAQRTAGRDADEAAARQGRWHRARAPLRGSGAGRKQELARGVRS